ncbi:DUF2357 domain-containing protein [Streptomyces sp. IBSBF 2435]|uniref:DUF2357 domain-containing protein n=1 Tax=Streptomyces sp. IBSBF 2435 TaxID=2903531 RepID=UPI002FDC553E
MSREPSEPEPDSLVVRHLLALSSRLAAGATGLDEWLALPPIVLDVHDETEALPVEEAFERGSGALHTVCNRPYTRLRTVEETVPTAQVRSVAAGAAARLAGHPEDWASRTFAGVRPARLLARRSEEDVDIYENRVAVAILDLMRSHLQRRIAGMRDLSRMVGDVHGLLMSSGESSWRARRDLTGLLRNIEDSSKHQAAVDDRLEALESSLAHVEVMLGSPLAQAVDHRSSPPRELHPTNLFGNDPHYRRVALLWQDCTAIDAAPAGDTDGTRRGQELGAAFERFTALLLLLACTLLKASPEAGQPAPAPGRTARFMLRGAPLSLHWRSTGGFVLEWRGRQALGVLPITTDLCTAPDVGSVTASIDDVRGRRPPTGCENDLIVYPGALGPRQTAEPGVVEAAYRIGQLRDGVPGEPADVAPLSPLDIFSVSRLVRAVQWATLGADARRYPRTVPVTLAERSALADCDWTEERPDAVAVVRPPRPEELDRLPLILQGTRGRSSGGRAARDAAQRQRAVREALEDAAAEAELLAVCPVCAKPGAQRQTVFEPREAGGFAAACSACSTRWEVRRCTVCGAGYPLLDPDNLAVAGGPEPHLDRHVGGAVLAVPCWAGPGTSQSICPACGTCGHEGRVPFCARECATRKL